MVPVRVILQSGHLSLAAIHLVPKCPPMSSVYPSVYPPIDASFYAFYSGPCVPVSANIIWEFYDFALFQNCVVSREHPGCACQGRRLYGHPNDHEQGMPHKTLVTLSTMSRIVHSGQYCPLCPILQHFAALCSVCPFCSPCPLLISVHSVCPFCMSILYVHYVWSSFEHSLPLAFFCHLCMPQKLTNLTKKQQKKQQQC